MLGYSRRHPFLERDRRREGFSHVHGRYGPHAHLCVPWPGDYLDFLWTLDHEAIHIAIWDEPERTHRAFDRLAVREEKRARRALARGTLTQHPYACVRVQGKSPRPETPGPRGLRTVSTHPEARPVDFLYPPPNL
jgi:hypothetical protein